MADPIYYDSDGISHKKKTVFERLCVAKVAAHYNCVIGKEIEASVYRMSNWKKLAVKSSVTTSDKKLTWRSA